LLKNLRDAPVHELEQMRREFRFENGQAPFRCKRCWTKEMHCVCASASKHTLPSPLELIVWVNHAEWGSESNSGSILGLTVEPCHVLMQGLLEHDEIFYSLVNRSDVLPVVLWPNNGAGGARNREFVNSESLMGQSKKIVVITLDGTWRQAKKLFKKLPNHVKCLSLPQEEVELTLGKERTSLLAPVRGGQRIGRSGEVCTAEAAVTALRMLGHDQKACDHVLDLARMKVEAVARARGFAHRFVESR